MLLRELAAGLSGVENQCFFLLVGFESFVVFGIVQSKGGATLAIHNWLPRKAQKRLGFQRPASAICSCLFWAARSYTHGRGPGPKRAET